MTTSPALRIYGVPMDLGQNRRGVDMGPSAIRYAGLHKRLMGLGWRVLDCGNVPVPGPEEIDDQPLIEGKAYHVTAIAEVCHQVYDEMLRTIAASEHAIFLGGDHSIALGTVAGSLERDGEVGVIWVDAHGDFNTPQTTPSGNVHGMVVNALMGLGLPKLALGKRRLQSGQLVMIGVRDLDAEERVALRQSGIQVLTMRDLDEDGMARVVQTALDTFADVETLHLSLDMDALDPSVAPGVGTPSPGGLTYREAHLLMEILADDGRVRSLDIVEVNPILDVTNRTAQAAVDLTASLFGQRIL